MILLLFACAKHDVGVIAAPGHVTILHTNDLHGHFLPEPAEWLENRPAIGGFERLDAELRAIRAARGDASTLTLDGGDILTGTPLTDIEEDGATGTAMLRFLKLLEYDAWAIGNHEFDKGLDNLSRFSANSAMPLLSANVRSIDGTAPLLPNQKFAQVFTAGDVKVGVIGVTTEDLGGLMSRADFGRLKLTDVAESVRGEVERLDATTDLIVVLSHIGVEHDARLAREVQGIDLIVGGHSHTRMTTAVQVGATWIVQSGSYGRSLGVVDLIVSHDGIAEFHYELRDLLPETLPMAPSAEVHRLAEGYSARIDAVFGEVIATAPALMSRSYYHESALGRWITDVLVATTGADIGLYNGGGLRADIGPGPVPRRAIFECFPFRNEIMTFTFTGAEVMDLLVRNAIAESGEKKGFLPISGVRYTWRERNGAAEIVQAYIGGNQVDLAKTYTIATNSYIAEQWEKHLGAKPRDLKSFGMSDYDAALEYAAKHGVHDPGDVRAEKLGG